MRKALTIMVVIAALLAFAGALAGSAAAAGAVASWSERQTIPGLTERTIWGRGQVYVYRLPQNVTHTGDLHVELTYAPADCDCFVYLLGPGLQGVGRVAGLPRHLLAGLPLAGARPRGRRLRGPRGPGPDAHARRRAGRRVLRGRAGRQRPVARAPDGLSAEDEDRADGHDLGVHVHAAGLQRPGQGQGDHQGDRGVLRQPVRPDAHVRGSGRLPPAVPGRRRRAYGPAGDDGAAGRVRAVRVPAALGARGRSDPAGADHLLRQLGPLRREPPRRGAAERRRLVRPAGRLRRAGRRPVAAAGHVPLRAGAVARRGRALRAGARAAGTSGHRPAEGSTTRPRCSSRRTCAWPRPRPRSGGAAGRRSRARWPSRSARRPAPSVQWAAPGTLVTVQRKVGAAWTPVRSVRTGANGAWRLKVRVVRTTRWRAVAQGGPGLAVEYSLVKRTVVRR